MKKRILSSLILYLGIALVYFLKSFMNMSLIASLIISAIFIFVGVLIVENYYDK